MKRLPPEPTRKRGNDRRVEIVEAARRVFVERGYSGASTDAILERAGGSKETIYAHFGNKLGLFRAVLLDHVSRVFEWTGDFEAEDPATMLQAAGLGFLRSLEGEGLRLARIVTSEIDRVGDISSQLQEALVGRLVAEIAASLERFRARGLFPAGDTLESAQTFVDVLSGRVLIPRLFDPKFEPSPSELEEHVRVCADIVLRLANVPRAAAPRPKK